MGYKGYSDGLYIAKQPSDKFAISVDHYGIIDIGNKLGISTIINPLQPVVIHQTPPSLQLQWLQDTGSWTILGKIHDERMAKRRIREASKNPNYDVFGNNCEHFARYIAGGERKSNQLRAGVTLTGLLVLAAYMLNNENRN